MKKNGSYIFIVVLVLAIVATGVAQEPDRLRQDVKLLASDALEGRLTGSKGATEAANYIAKEFSRVALKPQLQKFPYVAGVSLGSKNFFQFSRRDSSHNEGFVISVSGGYWVPLGFSSSAKVDGEIVFVGYGITASELNHNDYAGVNATGKIAIALQGTPDGANPHGQFARFEGVRWKAVAARNAGAKALVVIAREPNFHDDRLAKLVYDNTAGDAGLPVVVIGRDAAERIFKASDLSLAQVEEKPSSRSLYGEINLTTDIVRSEVPAYNVVAILEGSDPVLKNETIIVGAHYDHLGRGGEGSGSLAPRSGDIHYGADDNASGTAGVIELARLFTAQKPRPKRTIIFMTFGGEEEGLLGSSYYVNHPLLPLANTVAMINMDMIGRMRERKLMISGVGTAKEWRDIIAEANTSQALKVSAGSDSTPGRGMPVVVSANGRPIMTMDPDAKFDLTLSEDGYGPSDHSSFYSKQIPVLFFWTGTHNDYHKPSDTFEKINYEDEARILAMVVRIVNHLDSAGKRLTYTTAKSDATPRTGGFRVYLGTIPNYADTTDGLLLDGVRDDSPASRAGLKAGDRIVKIGTREIKNVYDYTYALGEMKAGEEYTLEVVRGTERLVLKIKPEARK
jgi:peptidase M28-like protein/PDZ domain-containing protein/PA domain-containing protein